MEILECYLQRNLVSHGGFLDEIHFVINTGLKSDLEYIHNLTDSNELYKVVEFHEGHRSDDYQVGHASDCVDNATTDVSLQQIWARVTEKENMYIKIDDDLVGRILQLDWNGRF